jgi:hypothetical protein
VAKLNASEFEPKLYSFDFTDHEWDEIESLAPCFDMDAEMPRGKWYAIGLMALGKAQLLDEGRYGMVDPDGNDVGDADGVDIVEWACELRSIAHKIFEFFQPGDGKI